MIYLDNSATSQFKPNSVIKAVCDEIKNSSNSGRSGHKLAIENALKIEKCRQFLLAKLHGENSHNIIFTKNATEGLNLALLGFLKEHDHVVTTCFEHNSVLRPLFHLAKSKGVDITIVEPKENGIFVTVEDLKKHIKPNTKLIAINTVSNVNGATCDHKSICKHFEIPILLDASQGLPILNFDLEKENIAFLVAPGHKGLHGIQGTGFLAVRNDLQLTPLTYGGTGTNSYSLDIPDSPPERYETGTLFSAGIHGLYYGAKWTYENIEKIKSNNTKLSMQLVHALKTLQAKVFSNNAQSGVISFILPNVDPSITADILDKNFDIAVRSGLHCAPLAHKFLGTYETGTVRASLGVETTTKDVEQFVVAVEKIKLGIAK